MPTCPTCGANFASLKDYTAHINTHNLQTNFACQTCGKTFTTEAELKVHERAHNLVDSELEGEIKHKCNICGKELSNTEYYQYMETGTHNSTCLPSNKLPKEIEHWQAEFFPALSESVGVSNRCPTYKRLYDFIKENYSNFAINTSNTGSEHFYPVTNRTDTVSLTGCSLKQIFKNTPSAVIGTTNNLTDETNIQHDMLVTYNYTGNTSGWYEIIQFYTDSSANTKYILLNNSSSLQFSGSLDKNNAAYSWYFEVYLLNSSGNPISQLSSRPCNAASNSSGKFTMSGNPLLGNILLNPDTNLTPNSTYYIKCRYKLGNPFDGCGWLFCKITNRLKVKSFNMDKCPKKEHAFGME